MNKKLFYTLLASLFMASCSDNNSTTPEPEPLPAPSLSIETKTEGDIPALVGPESSFEIKFTCKDASEINYNSQEGWTVEINETTGTALVTAPAAEAGNDDYTLTFTALNEDGQSATASLKLHRVHFDDPRGAFVLNEGNMTSENGSLVYITPEGWVMDNAYAQVNGTELGNVCQDMCLHDGKLYIISQNGDLAPTGASFENDGMLVIADAVTLKKIKSFSREELEGLSYPTHIAVLDEQHVYIRAKGQDINANTGIIYRLNAEDGTLVPIEGSEGAPQTPFVTDGNKVYTFKSSSVLCKLWSIDASADRVNSQNLPYYLSKVHEIQSAGNGQIWILAEQYSKYKLLKADLNNPSSSNAPSQSLPVLPAVHHNLSGHTFAAHGNTVYYNDDTTLYRLNFDNEEAQPESLTDLYTLDDKALELYNGMAVNPTTGQLYVNTVRGVGNFYTTNSIWVFDTAGTFEQPQHKLDNYTHFPAGTFFPVSE